MPNSLTEPLLPTQQQAQSDQQRLDDVARLYRRYLAEEAYRRLLRCKNRLDQWIAENHNLYSQLPQVVKDVYEALDNVEFDESGDAAEDFNKANEQIVEKYGNFWNALFENRNDVSSLQVMIGLISSGAIPDAFASFKTVLQEKVNDRTTAVDEPESIVGHMRTLFGEPRFKDQLGVPQVFDRFQANLNLSERACLAVVTGRKDKAKEVIDYYSTKNRFLRFIGVQKDLGDLTSKELAELAILSKDNPEVIKRLFNESWHQTALWKKMSNDDLIDVFNKVGVDIWSIARENKKLVRRIEGIKPTLPLALTTALTIGHDWNKMQANESEKQALKAKLVFYFTGEMKEIMHKLMSQIKEKPAVSGSRKLIRAVICKYWLDPNDFANFYAQSPACRHIIYGSPELLDFFFFASNTNFGAPDVLWKDKQFVDAQIKNVLGKTKDQLWSMQSTLIHHINFIPNEILIQFVNQWKDISFVFWDANLRNRYLKALCNSTDVKASPEILSQIRRWLSENRHCDVRRYKEILGALPAYYFESVRQEQQRVFEECKGIALMLNQSPGRATEFVKQTPNSDEHVDYYETYGRRLNRLAGLLEESFEMYGENEAIIRQLEALQEQGEGEVEPLDSGQSSVAAPATPDKVSSGQSTDSKNDGITLQTQALQEQVEREAVEPPPLDSGQSVAAPATPKVSELTDEHTPGGGATPLKKSRQEEEAALQKERSSTARMLLFDAPQSSPQAPQERHELHKEEEGNGGATARAAQSGGVNDGDSEQPAHLTESSQRLSTAMASS